MAKTKYTSCSRSFAKARCGEEIHVPRSHQGCLFGPGADNRHGFLRSFKMEWEARNEAEKLNAAGAARRPTASQYRTLAERIERDAQDLTDVDFESHSASYIATRVKRLQQNVAKLAALSGGAV